MHLTNYKAVAAKASAAGATLLVLPAYSSGTPGGKSGGSSVSALKYRAVASSAVELRTLAMMAYFKTQSTCPTHFQSSGKRHGDGGAGGGSGLREVLPPIFSTAPYSKAPDPYYAAHPLLQGPAGSALNGAGCPIPVGWSQLRLSFTHDRPPNSQALIALNGALVALAIDNLPYTPGPWESSRDFQAAATEAQKLGLPGILATAPVRFRNTPIYESQNFSA